MARYDDIKFTEPEGERQSITVQLPPRREIIAKVGALLIKDNDILMKTVPFPGTILPFDLDEHRGQIIAQKGTFLFGTAGCRLTMFFQKRLLSGLFSGEGCISRCLYTKTTWIYLSNSLDQSSDNRHYSGGYTE